MKSALNSRSICATLAIAAALLCPAAAHAFEPRVPESFFGVSAPDLWFMNMNGKGAQRDAQLESMKEAGIDWVRTEIGWPGVEPEAPQGGVHSYDWQPVDRQFEAFAMRGMELYPKLGATPSWAAAPAAVEADCDRRSAVAADAHDDFAAFVAAFAERYGPDGAFWASRPDLPYEPVRRVELWNEPNFRNFWCPAIDPEAYASLFRAASDAIRLAKPEIDVVLGGLAAIKVTQVQPGGTIKAMAVDAFLDRMLAEDPGLGSRMDAIGFHPYDLDADANLALLGWLRQRMEERGLGAVQISLTEFGWSVNGLVDGLLTEAERALNYDRFTDQVARTNCGVSSIAAHTWQSPELDPLDAGQWLGITSPLTGLLYPSGEAYRDVVALFEGRGPAPAPRATITLCGGGLPDQDGDGTPDQDDDYPLDPTRDSDPGEEPPPDDGGGDDEEEQRVDAPRVHDSFYGVNVVELPADPAGLTTHYGAMAEARIGRVRQRLVWAEFEPDGPATSTTGGQWQWLDRLVVKMGLEEIGLVPAFGAAPEWARTAPGGVDAAFAEFLSRFAQRYGTGGTFWDENGHLDPALAVRDYEIWEEANLDQNSPDGSSSAGEYASMYAHARASLRAVDPEARALASVSDLGHAAHAADFLRGMVAARPELEGQIDGVYVMSRYGRTVHWVEPVVADVRFALDETGNAEHPIFVGFGAPTAGSEAMTEAERAQFFTEMASRMPRSDCGVEGIFAHSWTTPESDPTNPWHWFGIADRVTAEPTEAAAAYGATAGAFLGYGPAAPREAVHPCSAQAPDRDGDGVPDPVDSGPLDPESGQTEFSPPPAPTLVSKPEALTASRTASFTYHADGTTSFQCRLDDARYEGCDASGKSYSGLHHGDHLLRIRAVDSLGLVGAETEYRWSVDVRGPTARLLSTPPSPDLDGTLPFEFEADEAGVKFACRFDAQPWYWCESPAEHRAGDGNHEFRVAAVDQLGNTGPIAVAKVEVRTTPGVPSFSSGPANGSISESTPRFEFSAPYAAGYLCRFDGATFRFCSEHGAHSPAEPLADGAHRFEVVAFGGTGIRGPVAGRDFTVLDSTGSVEVSGGVLSFAAGPGATNRLELTRSAKYYVVTDTGSAVDTGTGCVSKLPSRAICPLAGVSAIDIDLGDGDDRALLRDAVDASVDGGAGKDRLISGDGDSVLSGGEGNDNLEPGTGSDELIGGPGSADSASYAARGATEPLSIDIDGVADDGNAADEDASGSRDNVRPGIERLIGGAGGDTIIGSQHPNRITGGGGEDTINGLAASDKILVHGDGAVDTVSCGAGEADHVFADEIDIFPTDGPDACQLVN